MFKMWPCIFVCHKHPYDLKQLIYIFRWAEWIATFALMDPRFLGTWTSWRITSNKFTPPSMFKILYSPRTACQSDSDQDGKFNVNNLCFKYAANLLIQKLFFKIYWGIASQLISFKVWICHRPLVSWHLVANME